MGPLVFLAKKQAQLSNEMKLVTVCLVLVAAAAAVPNVLAMVDLFRDCRAEHHHNGSYSLHCTEEGVPDVSCHKDELPDIPPGYHYVPGYGLIRLYRTFKTWAAAKKFCEDQGARLAVPPDRFAYDGLKQIFLTEKGIWYAYIGITDQASEGVFVGVDGRPVSYLPWQPNEPDNGKGSKEDCVDVRNDGLLNDAPCGRPEPFFCERRLTVGVPQSYSWVSDAGRFYKVHDEKKAHAEAARICRSENATLAVTDTWRRGEALLRLFEPKDDLYLIGFTDKAVEGDFVTETGRHLRDMEFQVWGPNEPNNNNKGKPENCLALSSKGFYNDVSCDLEFPFICEIDPL